jgi:hypothetical protein
VKTGPTKDQTLPDHSDGHCLVIEIQQLLHGYSGGHRRLVSSIDLPLEADYAATTMSDLSGQSLVAGFEEYLTGYPLPKTSFYALARTWYAPEMDRPGCVWTQTLLIERGDLDQIPNFDTVLSYFVRPMSLRNLKKYSESIFMDSATATSERDEIPNHYSDVCDA